MRQTYCNSVIWSFSDVFLGRKLFEEKACYVNLDETFQSATNRMVMRYKADVDLPFNSLVVNYWHGKGFTHVEDITI